MPELPSFNRPSPDSEATPIGDALTPAGEAQRPSPPDRWQGVRSLLAWTLRWALLGAGVGGAWGVGLLVAQFFPDPTPEPPLQEIVTRRTHRFIQKVRRLPEWWSGDSYRPRPTLSPIAPAPSPTDPEAAPDAPRPVALSADQRQQITAELEAVQTDLQRLRDRVSALETQLNLPTTDAPLEERLVSVANRLSPPTADDTADTAPASQSSSQPEAPRTAAVSASAVDPLFQLDAYRVTLPSEVLFNAEATGLQANADALLDNILLEIARYPGSTILVGAYTDQPVGTGTPTELSYRQAMAVRTYLSERLGDESYHWVAIGYGEASLGIAATGYLTRRVTIAILR